LFKKKPRSPSGAKNSETQSKKMSKNIYHAEYDYIQQDDDRCEVEGQLQVIAEFSPPGVPYIFRAMKIDCIYLPEIGE
jgi:hypothetical protein